MAWKLIISTEFTNEKSFLDANGNPVTQSVISVTDASGNSVTGICYQLL